MPWPRCSDPFMYGKGKVPSHFGNFARISAGESWAISSPVGASTSNTRSSSHLFWYFFSMAFRASRFPVLETLGCKFPRATEYKAHLLQFNRPIASYGCHRKGSSRSTIWYNASRSQDGEGPSKENDRDLCVRIEGTAMLRDGRLWRSCVDPSHSPEA